MPEMDWSAPAICAALGQMRHGAALIPDADPYLVADLVQHAVNEALVKINEITDRAPGFSNQLLISLYTLQMLQACSGAMQSAVRRISHD